MSGMSVALCVQVYIVASSYNVDTRLIDGIIQIESTYRPSVIGDDGKSIGLMQVQLPTARDMGFIGNKEGLLDPNVNLNIGTKYLKMLLDRYDGDTKLALKAYNKGMGVADRYKDVSVLNDKYVNKVLGTVPICN